MKAIDFRLQAGEVLGIVGVSGNGQGVLAQVLSGTFQHTSGDLLLFGTPVESLSVADAVAASIGRIPEDRNKEGVIGEMAIWENAILERLRPFHGAASLIERRGWNLPAPS